MEYAKPMSHGKLHHRDASDDVSATRVTSPTLSPLENFHAREERLRALLYALNDAFDEKLAALATKQLAAQMSRTNS